MIVAPVLLGYALLLGTLVSGWLRRSAWPDRAPRLAIAAWFSLAVSAVIAVVLAGAVLVIPASSLGHDLAAFARICAWELERHYGIMGGCVVGTVGTGLMALVPLRLLWSTIHITARVTRRRRSHLDRLRVAARRDHDRGVLVIEHPVASAYCLPGRGGTVVLTSAALSAVPDPQLESVLRHERAHLRGHHHHLVAAADILAHAFGVLPLFRQLPERVSALVELRADDVAATAVPRRTLAAALLAFAEQASRAVTPAPALAATGADAVHRMDRLLSPRPRLPRMGVGGVVTGSTLVVLAPILLAVVPAVVLVHQVCCA